MNYNGNIWIIIKNFFGKVEVVVLYHINLNNQLIKEKVIVQNQLILKQDIQLEYKIHKYQYFLL